MRIEVNALKLKNALLLLDKVTSKNLTLPILGSILFIASGKILKLRATNLSLGVEFELPAKIEKEGLLAIPSNIISETFANFQENESITMEEVNGNLNIKTKKSVLKIKGNSPDDFPTIPRIEENVFEIEAKKIIEGVKSVYFSSAVSDIKPEISSVFIYSNEDSLVFVSTDSFRLAEKKIKTKQIPEITGILIPYKNINEILRVFGDCNETLKVAFNKNQISFSSSDIYLTSRLIDGIFPDYRQIIPKETKTEAVVLKQDLLNALKISNVFSDKFNQLNFIINPKEKIFEINSSNNDVGENKTRIDGAMKGESVSLSFNYKYFLDCFPSINTDSVCVKMSDTTKPIIVNPVSDNSFLYLIMPMNK